MQLIPGSQFIAELLKGIEARGAVSQQILFVIGSGLSLPVEGCPGVPGTAEIVKRLRDSLSAEQQDEFDRRIEADAHAYISPYQSAFKSIGPSRANKLIIDVVLDALREQKLRPLANDRGRYENGTLTQLEMTPTSWSIRPGLLALGEIFARHREVVSPYILTTNFDPLIKLSLSHHGVVARRLAVSDDIYPGVDLDIDRDVTIVHLHGYWREIETMHTAEALRHRRPRLKEWLKSTLLREVRVVVLGYGGWDDLLMDCLRDAVPIAPERDISVDWTFYGRYSGTECSRLVTQLSEEAARHPNQRVTFYEDVNVDTLLPQLVRELDRHRARAQKPEKRPASQPRGLRELCHEALAALATAQRVVALKNFRIAEGSIDNDASARRLGYGWRQELSTDQGATLSNVEGAPSALATAQGLEILAGLAAPPPLLAQLLARPWLDARANPRGGWSIEELPGRSLVRVTAFIVQTASRARFATSPRALVQAAEFLLRSQHSTGGWGYHETCAPDVISTAQASAALSAIVRYARDALGDLVVVKGEVGPVEDAIREAITAAANFLMVRQSVSGTDRGCVHSGLDAALGEVPTRKVSGPAVARLVRTAEAAFAFRAISESPDLDSNVRGRAVAALERAGGWLVRHCEQPDLETADYVETWSGGTSWSHCVQQMALRGLIAAHVSPTTPQVGEIVGRVIRGADSNGLWAHPSRAKSPVVFATKDSTCALREYAAAVAGLDPSLLLDGPRMAVVDASHYGLYRGGLFGVTVVRPSTGGTGKLVRHEFPFGLPSDDLKPADSRASTLRTRLLVDAIARSTIESVNIHLERHHRRIGAAIAILRGGMPFIAALGDTFVHVPFGLLAGTRRADAVEIRWLLQSAPSGESVRVLLADLVANTGATLEAAVACIIETFGTDTKVVIACGFAHVDAIQRLERHPAIEEIHVAHLVNARDEETRWLAGIGFDAGDLAMGSPITRLR